MSGAGGRLVFSLVYFVALANALSLADFGRFATASAAGVMLSRLLAFGFISALYRTATVRPNLIGTFTAGFLLLALLSLPVLAAAAFGVYLLFFDGEMALSVFAAVILAEALLWRPVEVVLIVNNGLGRFGRASVMAIAGTLMRALFAAAFFFWPSRTLADWSLFYIAANAVSAVIAFALLLPAPAPAAAGAALSAPAWRIRSMWPGPRCCSTCRWSSTSCWCFPSAGRSLPASMPSSCGWWT